MLLYFAGLFDGKIERLLFSERYLKEYERETFTFLNILIIILVLMGSKEIYLLDEPHILLINKRKYIVSKAVAYLFFYWIIFIVIYFLYQVVLISIYGFRQFNYYFLINLLLNIALNHSVILLISGKTKSILKIILFLMLLFLFNKVKEINISYISNLELFYPSLALSLPKAGYVHVILISVFYYALAFFKHEKSLN